MSTVRTGKRKFEDLNIIDGEGEVILTIDNDPSSSHFIDGVMSDDCAPDPLPPQNYSRLDLNIVNNTGQYVWINQIRITTQSKAKQYVVNQVGINAGLTIHSAIVRSQQIDEFYDFFIDIDLPKLGGEYQQEVRLEYSYSNAPSNPIKRVPRYNPNTFTISDIGLQLSFEPNDQVNLLTITII